MPVDTIENVSTLTTKANVYFDGKAVSHGFVTADGQNKSVGVVLGPNTELTFTTGPAEVIRINNFSQAKLSHCLDVLV